MKINNPKVLIHKRQNHDSYAIAITDDSDDFHDGLLIVSAEPNGRGEDHDIWVVAAYYELLANLVYGDQATFRSDAS